MAVMTLRGFVKEVQQVVEKSKMNLAVKIAGGTCPNMEQYHRQCGRIEGLDQCVKLMRDMLGQLEEADDKGDLPTMGERP